MSLAQVVQGAQLTFHFALRLSDEQVVDSTFDKEPATFVVGDGNLPEGFEELLVGLEKGAEQTFEVPPEKAFGQRNDNNVQEMKRTDFAVDMPLSPGLMVNFADAQGSELPGVIAEIQGDWVTVDFNHPLAGKTLFFDVKILEIQESN